MLAQVPACVEQGRVEGRQEVLDKNTSQGPWGPSRQGGRGAPQEAGLVEYACLMEEVVPRNLLGPAEAIGCRGLGGQSQPLLPALARPLQPLTHHLTLSPRTIQDRRVSGQLVLCKAACPSTWVCPSPRPPPTAPGLTFGVQLGPVALKAFKPHHVAQQREELHEGGSCLLVVVHLLLRALARPAVQHAHLALEAELQGRVRAEGTGLSLPSLQPPPHPGPGEMDGTLACVALGTALSQPPPLFSPLRWVPSAPRARLRRVEEVKVRRNWEGPVFCDHRGQDSWKGPCTEYVPPLSSPSSQGQSVLIFSNPRHPAPTLGSGGLEPSTGSAHSLLLSPQLLQPLCLWG